ncbi:MAG: cytochrome c [Planctomycetota bacterium]
MYRFVSTLILCIASAPAWATDAADPARGLDLLLNRAYVPVAFDQQTFDDVWRSWEEPLRSQAEQADDAERRRLAYERYGLIERADDPQHRPMQYVVDADGNWSMNCFGCHQGTVAGQMIPGAPNAQFALETLTHDIRNAKLRLGKRMTDLDIGSMVMPLGTTVGTTNAVMFGVALMHYRDDDLNIRSDRFPPPMTHHDHDAPAWWNTSRKQRLYSDNFAPRGHRGLMQFIASKENGPEKFRDWEDDFRHIEAYIDSLEPPEYPFEVNDSLAERGRLIFEQNCAECHGTYGENGSYPERIVPIDVVATDSVRLGSLTAKHRLSYETNWINEYGARGKVVAEPGGYLAPPLDGVWASAPYFHNGSVPTLWHVLRPTERPVVWVRTHNDAYDRKLVGLACDASEDLPSRTTSATTSAAVRRRYFDTRKFGKSARGHDFAESLSDDACQAVLEYLKTL